MHRPLHQTIATLTLASLAILACQGPDGGGDPFLSGPHAVGYVGLDQSSNGGGSALAQFLPNTSTLSPDRCWTEQIGTCSVYSQPSCTETCAEDEYCSFNDSCESVCTPSCSVGCPLAEECYFDELGEPACRVRERFDAGTIEIAGAREDIELTSTLTSYSSAETLFDSGAALTVSATGSLEAGLGPFELAIVAPPTLRLLTDELPARLVFGTEDLVVKWAAGNDEIEIRGSGYEQTADGTFYRAFSCTATDAEGEFSIPRSILDSVFGARDATVEVSRLRSKTQKGVATVGSLARQTVEKEAWVRVTASSTSSVYFSGCGSNGSACDGECVDTLYNSAHCGECGAACGVGESCFEGECVSTCEESGGLICGDTCVEQPAFDDANCGGCGIQCANNQTCSYGQCVTDPDYCDQFGLSVCDGLCVALDTVENCGWCGHACDVGQTCQGSYCVTPTDPCASAGQTDCSGVCVSLDSDANCGSCGNTCGATQTCSGGVCVDDVLSCPNGLVACGGSCVSLATNSNCGTCGHSCGSGTSCNSSGSCVSICSGGTSYCGGQCVSLNTEQNCGACGNSCAWYEYCSAGTCRYDYGYGGANY